MNITFAQKIGLVSGGVGLIVGGTFLYAQSVSRPNDNRPNLVTEESTSESLLGESRSVGQIVQMEEQIEERRTRYNIESSLRQGSNDDQRQAMESLQNLSTTYNIPVTEISNFPGGTFPFEASLNYILPNIERVVIPPAPGEEGPSTIRYRYNPNLNNEDVESPPEELFKFSLEDSVTTLTQRNVSGLDTVKLEEAMIEIIALIIENLGESDFPFERIINNPNLRNLILAEVGLEGTIGSGFPPLTLEMLGLDTMELLEEVDPSLIRSIALLGDIYPQMLGYTRDPAEAFLSETLELLPITTTIQDIIADLNAQQLITILQQNGILGQILSGYIVQIPLFEFAPCGEKLLPNSPRKYSPAIPMCSLCKRYCSNLVSGNRIYHSYLFGNNKCGCDPAPGVGGGLPL